MVAGFLFFSFFSSDSSANIVIKVRALNPFETEEVAAISYPLPEELSPSDIISKNITFSLPQEEGKQRKDTFNVEYAEEEGRYFIIDEVMLGPREIVTLEVHVKDIWTIPAQRLLSIKQDVEALAAQYPPAQEPPPKDPSAEDPEPVEEAGDGTAAILQDEIFEQIDEIAARQPQSSVLKVGVEKHMEAYYENMEALTQVEADVEMLRHLLEPEEEEGEEEIEEGSDMQEELTVEVEILEEETPLAETEGLTPQDGALEPEGNTAE